MSWQERVSVDPKVLVGKPVVKGTRIAVHLILDLLAKGWTQQQILESYPNLTAEDIRACCIRAKRFCLASGPRLPLSARRSASASVCGHQEVADPATPRAPWI